MLFTSAILLLSATAVIAAPAATTTNATSRLRTTTTKAATTSKPVTTSKAVTTTKPVTTTLVTTTTTTTSAPVTTTTAATCNKNNIFTNSGFSDASAWYLTDEQGTGSVRGGIQTQYFPTVWPAPGGPSAYALNFNIPAGQFKSVNLEQSAPIIDGHNFNIDATMYLHGTTSASCKFVYYAGQIPLWFTELQAPPVKSADPSTYGWSRLPYSVPANDYDNIQSNKIGGIKVSCSAASNEAATITVYLDNISMVDQSCA